LGLIHSFVPYLKNKGEFKVYKGDTSGLNSQEIPSFYCVLVILLFIKFGSIFYRIRIYSGCLTNLIVGTGKNEVNINCATNASYSVNFQRKVSLPNTIMQ
jgi:hypothetical protein